MLLNKNAFGELVKSYRNQRGWSQEELAERWGYTREYVSQIERGKRKLDSVTQVMRLADILDIPEEKLEEIGRGIPKRKIDVEGPTQADSAILQMLLSPGRDMVRLAYLTSYLIWMKVQSLRSGVCSLPQNINPGGISAGLRRHTTGCACCPLEKTSASTPLLML